MSSLFSKENQEVFKNPLNLDNPILVQVLGICSALAVTAQLKPAIVMGLAVTIITCFQHYPYSNPYYCTTRCGGCFGNDSFPDSQSFCL